LLTEDFTTFTQVEEIDDIQTTATHVDFIDRRNRTTYLYKDYTADYFTDFIHWIDITRQTHGDSAWNAVWMLSNALKGENAMRAANDAYIAITIGGSQPSTSITEHDATGTFYSGTSKTMTLTTKYYYRIEKMATAFYLDIFSTAALRAAGGRVDGDWHSDSQTLQADYSMRYQYVGQTHDDNTAPVGSADMDNLTFIQSGSAELLGKFEAEVRQPGSAELLGRAEVQQSGSVELLGRADVQRSGSAELLGKAEIKNVGSAELLGKAEGRHSDTAELLARVEVQGSASTELLGKTVIRHAGAPVELLGEFIIRQVASEDLLSGFTSRQARSQNLLAGFTSRQPGIQELLAEFIARKTGSAELLAEFIIRHSASAKLLGKANIRHAASAEFLNELVVRYGSSVDLKAQANIVARGRGVSLPASFHVGQDSEALKGRFAVRHSAELELFSKLWIRHPSRLWTNRRYINGVVELDETELDDALLEYVIGGVMNDIRSQLISEAMLVYDSWTDITKTPKLIRRATTYGAIASLYSRDINDPNRRIVIGLRPIRIRAAQVRSAQERAMDYWESRMEKMMSLYLTSGGRRLMIVDTEDEEPVFSLEDIPFYSEDPFKIKVR